MSQGSGNGPGLAATSWDQAGLEFSTATQANALPSSQHFAFTKHKGKCAPTIGRANSGSSGDVGCPTSPYEYGYEPCNLQFLPWVCPTHSLNTTLSPIPPALTCAWLVASASACGRQKHSSPTTHPLRPLQRQMQSQRCLPNLLGSLRGVNEKMIRTRSAQCLVHSSKRCCCY